MVIIAGWLIVPVSWFNKKLNLFVNGRNQSFNQLQSIKETDEVIWFHCASLGEFEQGRPIIEKIKRENSSLKIVLTFFSPSGYEVRKNYEFADVICYLPLDTSQKAKRFLDLIHPKMAVFVKYEFWPNILKELNTRNIPTILVSGIFRKEQKFFKKGVLANFMKKSLQTFSHFFVQDEHSKKLLNSIDLQQVTVSGDTRFDRVFEITKQDNTLDFIADFVQDKHILVAGSTWKKDEELLIDYINYHATLEEKFIIAPHNIKDIQNLKQAFNKEVTLFSDTVKNNNAQVFIVDTIGVLTKVFSYAHVAYIGGGFEKGIHNILEPATFGLPVIIGPKYQKFKEAIDLVELKGCFVVKNNSNLIEILQSLKIDKHFREKTANISKKYILDHLGATEQIFNYIKNAIL